MKRFFLSFLLLATTLAAQVVIPWADTDKTGSSLADLATRSAGDLNSGTLAAARLPAFSGDATSSPGSSALTLATVNGNVGSFGSATKAVVLSVNAKGLITAANEITIAPAFDSITGTAAVTQGGTGRNTSSTAYGLLAAGTTATAAQQTLATGNVGDILVSGGSAALPGWNAGTGTGDPVRANSPTLVTPALGTPSSVTLTHATGLPLTTGVTGELPAANGGTGNGTPSTQNFVYIGNSLTAPITTGGGDAWPTILATLSMGTHATHYNYAVSGTHIDDMETAYTASAYARRPTGSITAATLFYFPGANDLFADTGAANGGLGYDANAWMALWTARINQAKADGFRVVAFTITPRGRWKTTEGTVSEFPEWQLFEARRKEINRRIRLASSTWDILVDAEAMFPDPNNTLAYIDHVHLTDAGYRSLALGINDILAGKSPAPSAGPVPYLDLRETARLEAMFGVHGIDCTKSVTNTFVNGPTFGTGDFEVVLSFRPRDFTTGQGLFGGASNSLGIRLEPNRSLLFIKTNVGNTGTSYADIAAEQTNLLFISRKSGVMYVRNRDRLINSFADASDYSAAQSSIGDRGSTTTAPFSGFVGPLMIFTRQLTATERAGILRDGFPSAKIGRAYGTLSSSAWANDGGAAYETFSGASAGGYTAVNSSSTGRAVGSDSFTVVVGQVVSFTYTLTLNSGEAPYLRIVKSDLGANYSDLVQLTAGTHTVEIAATTAGTAKLLISNSANTDYVIASIVTKLPGAALLTGGFSGATWADKSGNAANITIGTGNTAAALADR